MTGGLSKTTSTLALAAAAGLMLGSLTLPTAARAADLGGDCCADLETRVAELEATTVRKGNKKVSLTITGRVAADIIAWSESSTGPSKDVYDHTSDVYFGQVGDGPNIVLKGEGKIRPDLVAGFSMEIGINALNGGTHKDTASKSSGNTQDSHQTAGGPSAANTYVFLSSKSMGTLQLGKIDNADDDFNVNYDGSWIGGFASGRANSSFNVRDAAGKFNGNTYGSYLNTVEDGGENGIRYISPDFGGFSVRAGVFGDDKWGVGANFAHTSGSVTVGLGAGYGVSTRIDALARGNQVDQVTYSALSAGIKESGSGLFLSGDWTQAKFDGLGANPDGTSTNLFINGGWAKNVSGAGDTTIHVSYDRSNDIAGAGTATFVSGSVAHTVAVGIDQKIDSAASHIFLQYEGSSIDTPVGTDVAQSISSVTGGMAIQF